MLIKSNKVKVPNDVINVLVLIAGTTDPVNSDNSKNTRGNSFGKTIEDLAKENLTSLVPANYWNKQFKEDIEKFDEEYVNLVIFPFHGWTGDNSIKNREIAGSYLVNRLCGANGQKAFYEETYQKKQINFHLLGHSHGGNVINEMTKQIDKLGSTWPKDWKIKSLTYLSTPFFNDIHQLKVNEKFFHKDAEVFHAYNKYDLTQRMLADFSIEALANVLHNIDLEPLKGAIASTVKLMKNIPFDNLKEFHFEYAGARFMSHENGRELYQRTIDFFNMADESGIIVGGLLQIFEELNNLFKSLNQPYIFDKIDKKIKDSSGKTPNNTRKLISDATLIHFEYIISSLKSDIEGVIEKLQGTLNHPSMQSSTSKFDKGVYFSDMFESSSFFLTLVDFLDIDADTLKPKKLMFSIWNTLYLVLQDNIEKYDNTYHDPMKQLKGTFLENKISFKDVTSDDLYDGSTGSINYDKFIQKIEKIENNYQSNPSQKNLLDLLFTLLAQDDKAYTFIKELTSWKKWLNYGEYIITGTLDSNIKKVRFMLENIEKIFEERHCNILDTSHKLTKELESNNKDKNPYNNSLQRGSIMYLLVESHSTSRRYLHSEVKDFLKKVGAKK